MIYRKCAGCRQLTPEQQAQYNKALIQAYQVSWQFGSTSQLVKKLGKEAKKILEDFSESKSSVNQ